MKWPKMSRPKMKSSEMKWPKMKSSEVKRPNIPRNLKVLVEYMKNHIKN